MRTVFAIDPGSVQSAWVEVVAIEMNTALPRSWTKMSNLLVLSDVAQLKPDIDVVVEWTAPRGMPASAELFETMYWVGRFVEAALGRGCRVYRIERKTVVRHLTGQQKGGDTNVRQALIDLYGGVGGKAAAIGTKAEPGPLYGLKADMWAALAVALAFLDGAQTLPPETA